jgi:sec-independent protein translocase protein TatA
MPFGLQPWHLIVIAIVALIVFGPRRLPEIGHGIGKALTEFRKGAREMSEGFHEEVTQASNTPMQQPGQPVQPTYNPPQYQYAPPTQYPQGVQQPPQVIDPGSVQSTPSQPVTSTGNFCVHCGASNPAGARFCNSCGQQVNAVE